MAKGDDSTNPTGLAASSSLMGSGLPQSGQGVSGYGMDSIMPTLALFSRLQQNQSPNSGTMMSSGNQNPMIQASQFQQMLNPGFNFNTPISAPPMRNTYGQQNQSPFASFGQQTPGQNPGRTNPNPGQTVGNAQPRI